MSRFYRLFSACRSIAIAQKVILLFAILLLTVWLSGCLEFLRTSDFQQFQWETCENNTIKHENLNHSACMEIRALTQPTCDWLDHERSVLIIVKSAPNRIERRQAYRQTLSLVHQLNGHRIRTVFVMGREKDEEFNRSLLQDESTIHKDMLIGDFVDGYFNNTLKYMHSLKFAQSYCSENNSTFLVLLDDDYMVNLDNLISLISKHQLDEKLYMGTRMNSSPFRLAFTKFRVSIREYPFNAFPPYISGGCVLYSPRAVKDFYSVAQTLKLFRFDDVFAGIVAYYLDYEPQSNENFVFSRDSSIPWDVKIVEHRYSADEIAMSFLITNFTLSR